MSNLEKRLERLEKQSGVNKPVYVCVGDDGYWIADNHYSDLAEIHTSYPGRRVEVVKILANVSIGAI
jgi:hypothetical protein